MLSIHLLQPLRLAPMLVLSLTLLPVNAACSTEPDEPEAKPAAAQSADEKPCQGKNQSKESRTSETQTADVASSASASDKSAEAQAEPSADAIDWEAFLNDEAALRAAWKYFSSRYLACHHDRFCPPNYECADPIHICPPWPEHLPAVAWGFALPPAVRRQLSRAPGCITPHELPPRDQVTRACGWPLTAPPRLAVYGQGPHCQFCFVPPPEAEPECKCAGHRESGAILPPRESGGCCCCQDRQPHDVLQRVCGDEAKEVGALIRRMGSAVFKGTCFAEPNPCQRQCCDELECQIVYPPRHPLPMPIRMPVDPRCAAAGEPVAPGTVPAYCPPAGIQVGPPYCPPPGVEIAPVYCPPVGVEVVAPYIPMPGAIQRNDNIVESLRTASEQLEAIANTLERQNLYYRADELRELAGQLRMESRTDGGWSLRPLGTVAPAQAPQPERDLLREIEQLREELREARARTGDNLRK